MPNLETLFEIGGAALLSFVALVPVLQWAAKQTATKADDLAILRAAEIAHDILASLPAIRLGLKLDEKSAIAAVTDIRDSQAPDKTLTDVANQIPPVLLVDHDALDHSVVFATNVHDSKFEVKE